MPTVSTMATPNAASRTSGSTTGPHCRLLPAYGGLMVRKSAENASCAR